MLKMALQNVIAPGNPFGGDVAWMRGSSPRMTLKEGNR
jgi:hypothetical protein